MRYETYWLVVLTLREVPFFGSVMIKDRVQFVGHIPVVQIVLHIFSTSSTTSPPYPWWPPLGCYQRQVIFLFSAPVLLPLFLCTISGPFLCVRVGILSTPRSIVVSGCNSLKQHPVHRSMISFSSIRHTPFLFWIVIDDLLVVNSFTSGQALLPFCFSNLFFISVQWPSTIFP